MTSFALMLFIAVFLKNKLFTSRRRVYIRDFSIFSNANKNQMLSNSDMMKLGRLTFRFKSPQLNFMRRLSCNNGMGPKCSITDNLLQRRSSLEDARGEAETVMFDAV